MHWRISLAYTSRAWLIWKLLVLLSELGGNCPHFPPTWLRAWCMGCSLVKSAFLVYCIKKRMVDHAPRLNLYAGTAIVVIISEISNQFMLAVLSKSVVHRMKAPFNKIELHCKFNWLVSSVWLMWLCTCARLSIAEFILQLSAWLRLVAVHCLMSTTAACC